MYPSQPVFTDLPDLFRYDGHDHLMTERREQKRQKRSRCLGQLVCRHCRSIDMTQEEGLHKNVKSPNIICRRTHVDRLVPFSRKFVPGRGIPPATVVRR